MTKAEHQAARRRSARQRGDCGVCCRRPARPGRFECAACAAGVRAPHRFPESRAEHAARIRLKAIAEGRCVRCLVAPPALDRACCDPCLATMRHRARPARKARYHELRAAGRCTVCEAPGVTRWACVGCRLDRKRAVDARTAAIRSSLPQALAKPRGAASDRDSTASHSGQVSA